MVEKKMEIIIPTWNRSKLLERTLEQFKDSPFHEYKITIIDNHSDDETSQVCAKYEKIFPNLKVFHNNKNIGASANILRCYEIVTSEYTWLIGDNDFYDFTNCSEVIDAMESSKYDLIFIQKNNLINFKEATVDELFDNGCGGDFIRFMGNISTYIFKSDLFTSEVIQEGYMLAHTWYPHLAFTKKALNENFSVYFFQHDMRIADENPNLVFSTLESLNGWVSANLIFEKKYMKEGIKSFILNKSLLYNIIGGIISAKANNIENYRKILNELMVTIIKAKGKFIGIVYIIIMILVSLIPSKLAKIILNKFK